MDSQAPTDSNGNARDMKAEILSQTDHLVFPLVAAVLFVTIFVVAVWRVLRPGARQACAERAALVFDDGGIARPIVRPIANAPRAGEGPR
jgi:hypothetical protein